MSIFDKDKAVRTKDGRKQKSGKSTPNKDSSLTPTMISKKYSTNAESL